MRKGIISFIAALMIICSTGCKNPIKGRTEINKILFATVIGIDKPIEGKDTVKITITTPGIESKKPKEGKKQAEPQILTAEGSSFFEALRNFRFFADRKMFLGHVNFILIGEEAAKENVADCLDILVRDHELRLNSKVFVVKGNMAEKVINYAAGNDEYLASQLENLRTNAGGLSHSSGIELLKVIQTFGKKKSSTYIPYVTINNTSYPNMTSANKDIYMEGYAIFKEMNLIGYIRDGESRGFNWVKNKIESGVIVLTTKKDNIVSVEIIDSYSKIVPHITDDHIDVSINLKMSSNIVEINGSEKIFDESTIEFLENQQNNIIKSEIQSVIAYAKDTNTDFLDIFSIIEHKYPVKWAKIKNKKEKAIEDIRFDVEVQSRINRTYTIKESSSTKGGK